MKNKIKTIAFDADDTLWVNETYFQEAEQQFCSLLENYLPKQQLSEVLFQNEMKNLAWYGYGVKGFVLCMIETANQVAQQSITPAMIDHIIAIGHNLLQKPIELLNGVADTLEQLQGEYQLIVATKGDLLDQERKLEKSGLAGYFHHIEIMSDKKPRDYQKLLKHLNCKPEHFLMLGNSIKSDVMPVLELGGYAAHIPYHVTWAHEQHNQQFVHEKFTTLQQMTDILKQLR